MRVLCVGDSLGLPRAGVPYQDTWYYKLSTAFRDLDFIYKFKRGLTSNNLVAKYGLDYEGEYSTFYMPDIVITQFGIVDCAPRYLNDQRGWGKIFKGLAKLLHIENFFWEIVKYFRKRSQYCVYVSLNDFNSNVEKYIEELINIGVKAVVLIKIGMPGKETLSRSPFLSKNINAYNEIYDNISLKYPKKVITINPLGEGDDSLYVDGYHTNKKGADKIYCVIKEILRDVRL